MPKSRSPSASPDTKHAWAFRSRLRRSTFGWRASRLAIARVDEAVSEIRAVAKRSPELAAEGAVLFLEKVSPAVRDVDSSSGALGNAVHAAVQALVPLLTGAPVARPVREHWLKRLFEAAQDDDPPYLESLDEHWGVLCGEADLASRWADDLIGTLRHTLADRRSGVFAWFRGTGMCYSALFTAGRHDEILELLSLNDRPIWQDAVWGGRVLAARGKVDEAIAYVERTQQHGSWQALARFAEDRLLEAGRRDEAYARWSMAANQAQSHLATYRALARKYPEIAQDRILEDLIASTPGFEGKWFATAKTIGRLELAARLAWHSPCDPRTLTRAARDNVESSPAFAGDVALAALHWIIAGHGYELTGTDVHEAWRYAREAYARLDRMDVLLVRLDEMLRDDGAPNVKWVSTVLGLTPANTAPR